MDCDCSLLINETAVGYHCTTDFPNDLGKAASFVMLDMLSNIDPDMLLRMVKMRIYLKKVGAEADHLFDNLN